MDGPTTTPQTTPDDTVITLQQRAAEAIGRISNLLGDIPYMSSKQANFLAGFFAENGVRHVLELGTYQGKSAAFMSAIVTAMGGGSVTTIDRLSMAAEKSPNMHATLQLAGASDVKVILAERSLTWELYKLLDQPEPPQFDFCYFDGGHNWDVTGLAFFLVDKMLKPGGWIILDDLDWTYESMMTATTFLPQWLADIPPEERGVSQVRKVWNLLVRPHPGYQSFREEGQWGLAQKRS